MPRTSISIRQDSANKRVWLCTPTTGAAIGTDGGAPVSVAGTLATPAITTTNLLTSTRRTTFSSGATAGTVASLRNAQAECWRGNGAGLGGFSFVARIGLDTLQSGMRAFVGLADVLTAPTNVDPTSNTTPGKVGLAINANSGNWKLVNNVTGSAPTVLDLGASFPVNVTDLLELTLFCGPNDSAISYRVVNLSSGAETAGTLSSNIPANTTLLAVQAWVTNNATAAAAILAIAKIYMET